ncbi:MAG: hypothetical protein ACI4EN_06635 [Butyrivibrio sp.]
MKDIIRSIKHYVQLHKHRIAGAAGAVGIFCLIMAVTVLGKFIYNNRINSKVFDRNVAVYYMDVLSEDNATKLSERIVIEKINPGQTNEIDFYIRNGNGVKISQTDWDYEIEIIHTLNIPLVYELYDSEGNLLTGDIYETGTSIYRNDGSRSVYTRNADSGKMVLHLNKDNPNKITSDKYTLKIIWNKDDESADFKYVNELDFLYLNVYAYESVPVK